jgi:hypothetical protein
MHPVPRAVVSTPTSRARSLGALALGLLVLFGVMRFDAARRSEASGNPRTASSYAELQAAVVAPAEAAPTEAGLNRSHHPPALAYFVIVACGLMLSVRRLRAPRHCSWRRRLDRFFVFRRGPPVLLLAH